MDESTEVVERLTPCRVRKSLEHTKKLQVERRTDSNKLKKVGSTQIATASRISVVHQTLQCPLETNVERESRLLELIKSLFCVLKFPVRSVPLSYIRSIEKSKRAMARRSWIIQESTKNGFSINNYYQSRSLLSIGLNSVLRSIEKEDCVGIIVEKDVCPSSLTELLIPISKNKLIPIIALSGISSCLKNVTGIKSIAIGLRRGCAEMENQFYPVYRLLHEDEKSIESGTLAEASEESESKLDEGGAISGSEESFQKRSLTKNDRQICSNKRKMQGSVFSPVKYRKL